MHCSVLWRQEACTQITGRAAFVRHRLERDEGIIVRFVVGHSSDRTLERGMAAEEAAHRDFMRLPFQVCADSGSAPSRIPWSPSWRVHCQSGGITLRSNGSSTACVPAWALHCAGAVS